MGRARFLVALARYLPSEWLWLARPERATVLALHPQGLWFEVGDEMVDDAEAGRAVAEALHRSVYEGVTGQVRLTVAKVGGTHTASVERVIQPCAVCGREGRPAVLVFRHDGTAVAPLHHRAPLCRRPECRKKRAELTLRGMKGGERWTWVEGAGT